MGQFERRGDLQRRTSYHPVQLPRRPVISAKQYRAVDKPWYRLGHGIVLAYIAIGWLCSLAYYFHLRYENARRERGHRDEVIEGVDNKNADGRNGHFESVEAARIEKGDQWSGFRYSL